MTVIGWLAWLFFAGMAVSMAAALALDWLGRRWERGGDE